MISRRSSLLAWSAKTSKLMTRYVSQPQISGGNTRIKGGTNHKGIVKISTSSASSVEPSDQIRLIVSESPFLRSNVGKRRSATNVTIAGVIIAATMTSDKITTSGVTAKITIKGTNTVFKLPMPMFCSQVQKVFIRLTESSDTRTQSKAGSQKK